MPHVLACMPVSLKARRGMPYAPHRGSVVLPCQLCKEPCYVGPSQQKKAAEGSPIVCVPCCVLKLGFRPEDRVIALGDKEDRVSN
jgi:hypothetical protein